MLYVIYRMLYVICYMLYVIRYTLYVTQRLDRAKNRRWIVLALKLMFWREQNSGKRSAGKNLGAGNPPCFGAVFFWRLISVTLALAFFGRWDPEIGNRSAPRVVFPQIASAIGVLPVLVKGPRLKGLYSFHTARERCLL